LEKVQIGLRNVQGNCKIQVNEAVIDNAVEGMNECALSSCSKKVTLAISGSQYVCISFLNVSGAPLDKGFTPVVSIKFRINPHQSAASYKQGFVLYENVDHAKSAIKTLD